MRHGHQSAIVQGAGGGDAIVVGVARQPGDRYPTARRERRRRRKCRPSRGDSSKEASRAKATIRSRTGQASSRIVVAIGKPRVMAAQCASGLRTIT
ncbi:hypothetical protein ACFSTI_04840 [Rhizorhabdus histidinilytica]